ncbi:hypothetical protein [Dyella mobilis]|uniref:Uncharacterized protein n=1 Tax=Dyella mobilis TaxID=1849582 RepID=A0ABS2KCK0_9GAMM|nr:hypothetical protein [Dyella mobilis]MBM7128901.1 hypothetical protein [Dyella mobilis]GLQ99409.1 hypothetical protein GCM10007863_38290 [Dyella mobilis]
MRSISERDLAVLIPLLARKILELKQELSEIETRHDARADGAIKDRMQIQEMLAQYDGILETLRAEYEQGLAEGVNLPGYDDLTRHIFVKDD